MREDKFILRWAKRLRAAEMLGGECAKCGESNIFSLDFHHLDPHEKEYELSQITAHMPWEFIQEEVKKCQLLCRNCHTKEHLKDSIDKYNNLFDKIKEKSRIVHKISRPMLDKDYIYKLLKRKISVARIAKLMTKDPSTILDIARRLEIEKKEKLFLRRYEYNKSKEKINKKDLINFYQKGKTLKEIASIFNAKLSSVTARLRRLREQGIIKNCRNSAYQKYCK